MDGQGDGIASILGEGLHGDLPPKYQYQGSLGRGGMGEVVLAADRELNRLVALKFLRKELAGDEEARLQFLAEAQIAGQLDHPGVPPVHEVGLTPGGRLFYAMKRLRGETLAAILGKLLQNPRGERTRYSLRRLVGALERVADALGFAHERGVVHRDVKPENIMIGDYGDVQLMDWGLAKVVSGPGAGSDAGPRTAVRTVLEERQITTRFGEVKGTFVYMSPEQAIGAPSGLDGRADLYSLGCVLYEIATLRPPFDPRAPDLPTLKMGGHTRSPQWPQGWFRSRSLLDIALRAMSVRREERPACADELAGELRTWLETRSERERRRRLSHELGVRGKKLAARYAESHERLSNAEANLRLREASALPWHSLEQKRPLFRARAQVARVRVATRIVFEEACHLLEAARIHSAGNESAITTLDTLWRSRLLDAERRGDRADRRMAMIRLRELGNRPTRAFLRGLGRLMLLTDPPGARAWISEMAEEDGVVTPRRRKFLGTTPLDLETIPAGSYLAQIQHDGFRPVRYPVMILRGAVWRGKIDLVPEKALPEECVLVPAGVFLAGEEREQAHLDAFAICRRPVTLMEYLRFLIDTEVNVGRDEALARLPRGARQLYVQRTGERRYRVLHTLVGGEARRQLAGLHGEDFEARLPVVGISYDDATAYCLWRSAETGLTWRLPSELEREKAARGADGRAFPWGQTEDACFAKCRDSRPGTSFPEPVGAFPTATSVYGMEDAAGGVWEWTRSWFDSAHRTRSVRGGSWTDATYRLRTTAREGREPDYRGRDVGFRCALSLS